ncbi:MAG TPA: carbohydrate-binding family 9-like protein [Terriglobia bacterium]|nr:carbohydrate-binding family 9-like protein [Terriglobia bacterium]
MPLSTLALVLIVLAAAGPRQDQAREEGPMKEVSYLSHNRIEARSWSEDFVPDANLNKDAWKRAKWEKFDHDMSGRKKFPQARTEIATLWTSGNLYVAFRCRYSTLNVYEGEDATKERWELWNRDVAEIFVNPQPERLNYYYEFEVAPNNQWIDLEIDKAKTPFNDAGWNSGFLHATRVDASKHIWTCEMRIPVKSMGADKISAGAEWRVNFYRADGPGDDTQRRFMCWSPIPEGKTFHVPTRFGLIRFTK